MKGSMEGLLPMLALFIMSVAMATQSIPLAEALGQIAGETTSDIERVVDARAYGDFYFYNYIPLAAQYAVNEASFELGQDGGGEDWDNDWLIDYNTNMRILDNNLDDFASEKITATVDGSEGLNCEVPNRDYTINTFPLTPVSSYDEVRSHDTPLSVAHDLDFGEFGMNIPEPEPIEVECDNGRTFYIDEGFFYRTETNATNNRYIQLADETLRFFLDLEEAFDGIGSKSETKTACDSTRYSDAEEAAAEDLESEVESAIESVKEDYPDRAYFEKSKVSLNGAYSYTYGYNSDVLDADSSGSTNSYGDCDCSTCYDLYGNPYTCCDSYTDTTVTVSPKSLSLDWKIEENYDENQNPSDEDAGQKVIVGNEHVVLEFIVEPYEHDW